MQKLCRLLAVSFSAAFAPVNWAQTVSSGNPLAFGWLTAGDGTVTVDTNGARNATGNVKMVSGAPYTAATFVLDGNNPGKGKNAKSYSYDAVNSDLCTTGLTSGGNKMTLSAFTTIPSNLFSSSKQNKIALPDSRRATVTIGATAKVVSGQARGDYRCDLKLAVEFYD